MKVIQRQVSGRSKDILYVEKFLYAPLVIFLSRFADKETGNPEWINHFDPLQTPETIR